MAGRQRIPTAVLQARDAAGHNGGRIRMRIDEPEVLSRPLGPPPKHLTKLEKEMWLATVKEAFAGTLSEADRVTVEVIAVLRADFRTKRADFKQWGQLLAALGKLGMTPSDRSLVQQPSSARPVTNRFTGLRQRGPTQ